MGHNITHMTFDYETSKQKIMDRVENWVRDNCDRQENPSGDYHNNFRFNDLGLKGRDEAEKYIERNMDGYNDGAISFYDYGDMKDTSQIAKVKEGAKKIRDMAFKYLKDHSIQSQKANYIGCKNEKCESKIAREFMFKREPQCEYSEKQGKYILYIDNQRCPVCGSDLRADYIIAKQKEFEDNINELDKKLHQLETAQKDKNSKKAKKKWLVKIEVHS